MKKTSDATTINTATKIVQTTFSTKCSGVPVPLNITFNFSTITEETLYALALRSVIIDFQRTLRDMPSREVHEKFNDVTIVVGEKAKRTTSLLASAWKKYHKGEVLTSEEREALLAEALKIRAEAEVEAETEVESEFTITRE